VDPEGWHGRVAGGTGRAKSLTWGAVASFFGDQGYLISV